MTAAGLFFSIVVRGQVNLPTGVTMKSTGASVVTQHRIQEVWSSVVLAKRILKSS